MMDAVIIIQHESCTFFFDDKDNLLKKCDFIFADDIKEEELCEMANGKLAIGEEFQKNFQSLMQDWAGGGKHFLVMDYTNAGLAVLHEIMKTGGISGADVYCVAFFHNNEEIVKNNVTEYEQNLRDWNNWYLNGVKRFPSIHIEEIPFGFALTEDYLQALFDRAFPHSEAARYRRVWKGNPQRRIDAALSRKDSVPKHVRKMLEAVAAKKKEALNG